MHERQAAILHLLRNHPRLVVDLMTRLAGLEMPPGCTPCDGDAALVPGDPLMTADVVTLLKDEAGVTRFGIVVELPFEVDDVKRCLWTAHGEALREREGVECIVLVIALTQELAAWAKQRSRVASA